MEQTLKPKELQFYIETAKNAAKMSTALRLKVGAVLVSSNKNIVFYGYNGTPPGEDNRCEVLTCDGEEVEFDPTMCKFWPDENILFLKEDWQSIVSAVWVGQGSHNQLITKDNVIHAEDNAIRKAIENGVDMKNSTMFITHSPCKQCARKMIEYGIHRVYYSKNYRSDAGVKLLNEHGVTTTKLE